MRLQGLQKEVITTTIRRVVVTATRREVLK